MKYYSVKFIVLTLVTATPIIKDFRQKRIASPLDLMFDYPNIDYQNDNYKNYNW